MNFPFVCLGALACARAHVCTRASCKRATDMRAPQRPLRNAHLSACALCTFVLVCVYVCVRVRKCAQACVAHRTRSHTLTKLLQEVRVLACGSREFLEEQGRLGAHVVVLHTRGRGERGGCAYSYFCSGAEVFEGAVAVRSSAQEREERGCTPAHAHTPSPSLGPAPFPFIRHTCRAGSTCSA